MIDTLIAGLGSLGAGVANWIAGSRQHQWDIERQNQTWAREDNAVQRRAADLAAAGMNPVLAAGGAAQTSAPIRSEVPGASIGSDIQSAALAQTALMRQRADIATTVAQKKLTEMQTENQDLANKPMREYLASKTQVAPDGDDGATFTPREMMSRIGALQAARMFEEARNGITTSSYHDRKARADALNSELGYDIGSWDFGKTKAFNVRTHDQGINAPLEAVMNKDGGSPWASAIMGILDKALSAYLGVKGSQINAYNSISGRMNANTNEDRLSFDKRRGVK